jgi:hypothetical protein
MVLIAFVAAGTARVDMPMSNVALTPWVPG